MLRRRSRVCVTYVEVSFNGRTRSQLCSPTSQIRNSHKSEHSPPISPLPRQSIKKIPVKYQDREFDRPHRRPEEDDKCELASQIEISAILPSWSGKALVAGYHVQFEHDGSDFGVDPGRGKEDEEGEVDAGDVDGDAAVDM